MSTLNQVILEGADASKPSAGIPGRLYLTTDTALIYYDTGSAWTLVGPSGAAPGRAFAGALSPSPDGTTTVFDLTNGGTPIGATPSWAIVWKNAPLIPGVGYTLGPSAGQVTFTYAPAATDNLYGQGFY